MKTRRDSIDEAAETFGVSRDVLYRMAQRHEIPHSRIRSLVRVDLDELAEHFDQPVDTTCRCSEAEEQVSRLVVPPRRGARKVQQIKVDYDAL
jgi:excisionase family DNA binding protein